MSFPPEEDVVLMQQLCRGEPAAAHELYRRYGSGLLRFAFAMIRSRHTAEDVVHDAFIELLHRPERFDASRGPLAAYLYGIARHRLSRLARVTAREAELDAPDAPSSDEQALDDAPRRDSLASETLGTEDAVAQAQAVERVRAAVLELPLVHREVIALCDFEELPYATVALVLDCPLGTVRSRLHRARALLAIRLASLGLLDSGPTEAAVLAVTDSPEDAESSPRSTLMLSCRGTLR